MALANYPSWRYTDKTTRRVPYTPTLKCIRTAENTQVLNNFMNQLFRVKAYHFTESGRLRPAIEAYMATVLFYFEEFRAAQGDNHLIVQQILRVARDLYIPILLVLAWGSAIKDDVKLHDFKLPGSNIDNLLLIDLLKTSAVQAKRDNLILQQELFSLKTIVNETNERCTKIEKAFTQSLSPTSGGRKRPRQFWVREHIDICIYVNTYSNKYMYL
jgi:hypothetical protein